MATLPIKSITINRWDGGMTGDPRDETVNVQRIIQHFDNYTRTYKLTPYRDMIFDNAGSTEANLEVLGIKNILSVGGSVATLQGPLYALGVDGSGHPQIYIKFMHNDPTSVWIAATGTETSSGSLTQPNLFIAHDKYIYYCISSTLYSYGDITGSEAYQYEYVSNVSNVQGVVHSADDTLYIVTGGNTIYASVTEGTWNSVLQFATGTVISSMCEYGNYLAIAANRQDETCVVYLWDRNAALTTLPEIINWGAGTIQVIGVVAGVLCGVSTTAGSTNSLTPRVMVKYYSGTVVDTIQEFICTSATFFGSGQVFNNLLYFLAEITIDGTVLNGLWKIYKNPSGKLAVSFDILPRNNVSIAGNNLNGFYRYGDYIFICYGDPTNSGAPTVWRTDSQANYTATSLFTTAINQGMDGSLVGDRSQLKTLLSAGLTYPPLPSGASVTLSYRVDGGAWVPIFTETTTGKVRTEPINISGAQGTEIEFEGTSTGGGEITGLMYKYVIIPSNQ